MEELHAAELAPAEVALDHLLEERSLPARIGLVDRSPPHRR
jgi:hypothetical protein